MPRDSLLIDYKDKGKPVNRADSDTSLMQAISVNDKDAWHVVIGLYASSVSRYAAWILRDQSAAEDITQETFLRLTKKAATWTPGPTTVKAWLFRVARNLCIDRLRMKKEEYVNLAAPAIAGLDSLDIDKAIDIVTSVNKALNKLPERQKSALILVHFEGLTGAEAAQALGVSIDATESLLARARRSVRTDLTNVFPDLIGR